MEIKLDEIELLTILQGLEALYDDSKELKNIIYCDEQEYLMDVKEMRKLHNKLLIQAQNEGYLEKNVSLI